MKNLLLTLIFVSTCFSSFGQNETTSDSKKEAFIIKVGANQSFFNESKVAKWEGNVSYNVGLAYEIPLTEKLYIQPELNYFRLDAEAGADPIIVGGDILKVSLIGISPMFKYEVIDNLFVELGPELNYISYVARARHNTILKEKPNRRIKDFSIGASAGLSYDFYKGFGVEARYHLGFTEVDERPGYYLASYTDSDLGKLSFATLNLYYKF